MRRSPAKRRDRHDRDSPGPSCIHGALDHHRGDHFIVPQASHEGDCLPLSTRGTPDQFDASRTAPPKPHDLGGDRSLVNEQEAGRIKHALISDPAPARPGRRRRDAVLPPASSFFEVICVEDFYLSATSRRRSSIVSDSRPRRRTTELQTEITKLQSRPDRAVMARQASLSRPYGDERTHLGNRAPASGRRHHMGNGGYGRARVSTSPWSERFVPPAVP